MAPTTDEQLKLRLFTGELSQLGPADQFLKAMVDIPFAFKRMEALLFMSTLKEELNSTIESFAVLEAGKSNRRSQSSLQMHNLSMHQDPTLNVNFLGRIVLAIP